MNQGRTAVTATPRVRAASFAAPAALIGVAALIGLGALAMEPSPAGAQTDPPGSTTSTTAATTTTQAPTTLPPTTQAPVTTTTFRPPTTRAPSTTVSTAAPTSTTSVEETTTTTAVESTTTSAEPTIITPSTADLDAASSGGEGLSTRVKLGIVIGGLLAVAAAISVLTGLYWRRTRPVPAAGTTSDDDEPPDDGLEHADGDRTAPAATAGDPAAAAAVAGGEVPSSSSRDASELAPTMAVPVTNGEEQGTEGGVGDGKPIMPEPVTTEAKLAELWGDDTGSEDADGDVAALRSTLFGSDAVEPAPRRDVTLEDLFGPVDDSKGPSRS